MQYTSKEDETIILHCKARHAIVADPLLYRPGSNKLHTSRPLSSFSGFGGSVAFLGPILPSGLGAPQSPVWAEARPLKTHPTPALSLCLALPSPSPSLCPPSSLLPPPAPLSSLIGWGRSGTGNSAELSAHQGLHSVQAGVPSYVWGPVKT